MKTFFRHARLASCKARPSTVLANLRLSSVTKRFHTPSSRRKYARLSENKETTEPVSLVKSSLRLAGRGARLLFFQAKYLVPIEAGSVDEWKIYL